ncbi:hypothetical protein GKC29_26700 [Micromonospora sp. WMMC415]|uniref:hypothetical protein n=1 Tax=Micromonospora sp. WMMC415 TaxID=2675222 RepID=UPI0012B45EB4|nr:hypothetical protein [Micromonospora sp. WMMC415]QGN50056.1 hypothetical protein GKC29_26700 [Micromonospora sp. WMMC415]
MTTTQSRDEMNGYGNQTKIYGEVWFNTCCIPQRNAFTVKDRYSDGTRIKVYWSGARYGSYTLPDGAGRETTFSIEPNNVTRAVIHWKACTLAAVALNGATPS